jgi:hypothetical protein
MGIVRFAKEVAMLRLCKRVEDSITIATIAVGQKDARDYTVLDIRKALKLRGEELEKKLKEF